MTKIMLESLCRQSKIQNLILKVLSPLEFIISVPKTHA